MDKSKIGSRILQRRKDLGLTQEELAAQMEYKSKSSINKIEKGYNDVSQSKVVKFAEALHTTEAYLMGWTDDPDPKLKVTAPFSQEAISNLLSAIPSAHLTYDDELDKALELYRLYRQANPQIQNAVEILLKPVQSDT